MLSLRSISNLGCVFLLILGLTALFAIWPIVKSQVDRSKGNAGPVGGYNTGGINGTGQVPTIPGHFSLIDRFTPESALKHVSLETGEEWDLVFSDEFNEEGRTFWPGDDPFWEAGDQHYWSTNNLEWYDPRMITTENGHLKITLDKIPNHNLNYSGGLMTTWNKFCYTGGYFEASLSLPGTSSVYGLWPAVWTLGNLGRAGYGGTLDGMWPYSYNECDVGTLKNQSKDGLPEIAFTSGEEAYNYTLSYLPGQRLSACTCPDDETHPGPRNSTTGGFVGRSAPEIDMIEAQPSFHRYQVSQSAQWAPFNPYYEWINTSATYEIYDDEVVHLNSYQGGHYQQATSAYAITDQNCYTGNTGCMSVYGFEYATGDDGYITWVNDGAKSWTIRTGALGPNAAAEIGYRQIPVEPMYLIINLGISPNFGAIDYEGLESLWPTTSDPSKLNIGCDPPDYPTAAYIERYIEGQSRPVPLLLAALSGLLLISSRSVVQSDVRSI
ncbi:hypothetical protein FFLO_03194 [Filobasidium floriforme]|uniref:GH16 domain-containing protein n=1 Tax=Filobasidium floriforme TaxID=5210 RepID=A0A8K0JML6_9TREE|nr:beta-glucan synthesis-associated [Filobasidium floriforme]KAG7548902.1 hypothetical protein FFLO_03194 [Filobasidium floriforme]KAH8081114.1 beta-glucan synthesis-associated [Filobasidium floriforme]